MPGSTSQVSTPTLTRLSAWAAPAKPTAAMAAIATAAISFFMSSPSFLSLTLLPREPGEWGFGRTQKRRPVRRRSLELRTLGARRARGRGRRGRSRRQATLALGALTGQFTGAPHCFGLLASFFFGGLF